VGITLARRGRKERREYLGLPEERILRERERKTDWEQKSERERERANSKIEASEKEGNYGSADHRIWRKIEKIHRGFFE
jgi:hypothetical protein